MLTKDILSHESLLRAVKRGFRPEYLFFWGHKPLPNGEIGESCLSQWWPASFSVDGVIYKTAEHFMMAEKARIFGDGETRARILAADTPKEAKELGRKVRNFDTSAWAEVRSQVVEAGNLAKFSQNRELGEYLRATGDKVLVEASPVDLIWGIGFAADDEQARNPEQWRGLNLLGFALMAVRHTLLSGC